MADPIFTYGFIDMGLPLWHPHDRLTPSWSPDCPSWSLRDYGNCWRGWGLRHRGLQGYGRLFLANPPLNSARLWDDQLVYPCRVVSLRGKAPISQATSPKEGKSSRQPSEDLTRLFADGLT